MIFNLWEGEYRSPRCSVIRLDEEADICNGTNEAGNGYNDDNEMDDLG